MNILELLESITFRGLTINGWPACVSCENDKISHNPDCDLKAAIDALKSGRLIVVDAETAKLGKWAKNTLPVATPFKKEQGE